MQFTAIDIIYNPNSTGPSDKLAKELASQLKDSFRDIPINLRKTTHAGHAKKIAYSSSLKTKHPLIISSSGDGGYNEVINGAMKAKDEGANPICMVLPAGNANDHSRTVAQKPVFTAIKQAKIRKLDLLQIEYTAKGRVQKRYAHSYIGFGMTPEIAKELNQTDLNRVKEAFIALRSVIKFEPFTIIRKSRKETLDSLIFTTIGEMSKALTVAKNAQPDDGKFEVARFPHQGKIQLMQHVTKAAVVGLKNNKSYASYSFRITDAMPTQLDGEVTQLDSNSKITIRSAKHRLVTLL